MTKKGKLYKYFSKICAKPTNLQKTQNTKVKVMKGNEPYKNPIPNCPNKDLLCTYKSDKRAALYVVNVGLTYRNLMLKGTKREQKLKTSPNRPTT